MSTHESALVSALVTALLRENTAGLRTRGRLIIAPDGAWLALGDVRIPVRPGDFRTGDLVSQLTARAPFVAVTRPGRRDVAQRLPAVLRALHRAIASGAEAVLRQELRAGFAALAIEAAAALEAIRQRSQVRARTLGAIAPQSPTGWPGWLNHEAIAAFEDHPLHPLSAAKVGLRRRDIPRYAPEYRPDVRLPWVVVPDDDRHGTLPDWWPATPAGTIALPVHPATAPHLAHTFADQIPALATRPSLSLRTVAPIHEPETQLKLPIPMRTLGHLNLRVLSRAALLDGALLSRALTQIACAEPDLTQQIVIADETTWVHGSDPLLAVLIRRWPARDLDQDIIVPVAGLSARTPSGRLVIEDLAAQQWEGDLEAFVHAYLRALLGWHVMLWLRHGIVLEAHGQNVLIAAGRDRASGAPRLRLLMRDLDSGRIDHRARELLSGAPEDPRMVTDDRRELANLFVTTTLHQCVAAPLRALAVRQRQRSPRSRPAGHLMESVAPLLIEYAQTYSGGTGTRDAAQLHALVRQPLLPVKCGITAATVLPKTRTGASDVNKFYGADAPSYL